MEAFIKEFGDNGNIIAAVIWVLTNSNNVEELNDARVRLNNYISVYVGRRGHNVYLHTERDTVSAIVVFDLNRYEGRSVQI